MRVICFTDNDLADAIVDEVDFYLDDIATPGSFWLNPPNPRDDEGNKVDLEELIDFYNTRDNNLQASSSEQQEPRDTDPNESSGDDDDDMSDEELKQILADMSPL